MKLRNFFIRGYATGRENAIIGGPVSKDGSMSLTLIVKENGVISNTKIKINCINDKGQNHISIFEDVDDGHCKMLYNKAFSE